MHAPSLPLSLFSPFFRNPDLGEFSELGQYLSMQVGKQQESGNGNKLKDAHPKTESLQDQQGINAWALTSIQCW